MLSREVITEGTIEGILDWFTQFGGEILGLVDRHEEDLPDKEVETLIEERQQARQVRNFARADEDTGPTGKNGDYFRRYSTRSSLA